MAMRGSATERDGSVHQILFEAQVPSRVSSALAGANHNFPARWTPIRLTLVHLESGSRWTTTAAEYQFPYRSNRKFQGDTLRFKWPADPAKRPMNCELSRPGKRGGGAAGPFTGSCRDPLYSEPALLDLAMDPTGSQRPTPPWPKPLPKPLPPKPSVPRPDTSAPLLIRWTTNLEPVWTVKGNQDHRDATFYRPVLRNGFKAVGHMAEADRGKSQGRLLVVKENPARERRGRRERALLAPPIDYIRLWWGRSRSDEGWAIWQPIGALGYRCLGGVVTRGFKPPPRDEVVCLREDLLTRGQVGDLIWKHRSPRGLLDVVLFASETENEFPLGTFLARQESHRDATPAPRWVPRPEAVHEVRGQQRGPRFSDRNDDGTVLDRKTGLIWLQQTDCISERDVDSASRSVRSLRHGTCGLRDGSQVGDWRLPTLEEWLETQGDAEQRGCRYPALTNSSGECLGRDKAPFSGDVLSARKTLIKGSTSGVCWLSSTGRSGKHQVMRPGQGGWSDSHNPRAEGCVWPVRDAEQ